MSAFDKKGIEKRLRLWNAKRPLSQAARISFFQILAVMLNAGINIIPCLDVLKVSGAEKNLRDFATNCALKISTGHQLSEALLLSGASNKLTNFQISMIRVAEKTGAMPACFDRLAFLEEKDWRVQKRVSSALVYPAFVCLLLLCLVGIFLPLYVFPRYLEFIESLQVPVSPLLGLLLTLMRWTQSATLRLFVIGIVALAFSAFFFRPVMRRLLNSLIHLHPKYGSQDSFKKISDYGGSDIYLKAYLETFALRYLGPIGKFIQIAYTIRFARALQMTISAGCPLLDGLGLAIEASSSNLLNSHRIEMQNSLKEGQPLVQTFEQSAALPSLFLQMIAVGEETGTLAEVCGKTAQMYEDMLDYYGQSALKLLQPLLTVVMGIVVGLIVILIMYPIVEIIRLL